MTSSTRLLEGSSLAVLLIALTRSSVVVLAFALLVPRASRANPVLHVDPSLSECEVHFAPGLTQEAYRRFVREFGTVSAFKQGAPPATLGRGRVALDVEQIYFSVDEASAAWNDTFTHPSADHWLNSSKAFPKLRLRVGASDDVEVGAFFTKSLESNFGWLGVETKWAVLRQRADAPVTLALRAAYTKTLYVSDMNMHALTTDVSVGRTFWSVLTPYLGVGADAVVAKETSPVVSLKTEALVVPHATAGLEVSFWRVAVGAEAQVSALTSYQVQVSAVF
jgi:hypothetical protein